MAHINPCAFDEASLKDLAWGVFNATLGPQIENRVSSWQPWFYQPLANSNMTSKIIAIHSSSGQSASGYSFDINARYTPLAGVRVCLVKIKCYLYRSGATSDTTDFYVPVSNVANIGGCFGMPCTSGQADKQRQWRVYWRNNPPTTFNRFETYDNEKYPTYAQNLTVLNSSNLDVAYTGANKLYYNFTSDSYIKLLAIGNATTCYSIPWGQASNTTYVYGFPIAPHIRNSNVQTCLMYTSFPTSIPVFDSDSANVVTNVKNYLTTGSTEGSVDPFDPNNPAVTTVTDFKTNFDAYVTLGEPAQPYAGFTNIHWSVRALNEQYNEARDILAGMYRLSVYNTPIRRQGEPATGIEYKTTYAQVPVASFTASIPNLDTSHNVIQFYFGDSSYDLLAPELVGNTSGFFLIDYHYKKGSRSKCKIDKVKFNTTRFSPDWQNEGVELSRVSIGTDAYKYTASTGETLTIYFRGITLEDLNKTDDGYKENPDTEASPTESDVGVVSGSGLNTFSINKVQFNLINTALWSTDWTQVFKSSTIDPIKCVISCKGIKFANAGSGEVPIIIANRDTEVSSGVVNPVKSYTIDNCYIPAINGNFTDISLMRVRCYLPYIGWVDLPSAEVVGRLAYNGVPAVNKRLTFKYIVDFIDGACRCIVSVNGTERWMFDGNCAVDIPVTSDNHTNAIGTAIKSGLATTLSIATGVAGAISGNAGAVAGGVVGAINSAPNMLPTYEYSASASPSGYINGSCNSHIMIVCEIPNVQIPNGFARKVGRPCERNLSLGSLVGFTQCKNVNVSGINATTEELTMIAQELNSGVYL